MCFGHDGIGRITFGDKGILDQEETPFKTNSVQHELVYCLAIVKSQELNIIGQNFITGYRIVFDCNEMEDTSDYEPKTANYAAANVPASSSGDSGLPNHTTTQSTRNTAQTLKLAILGDFELSIYDPEESSTSKNVTCSNDLCSHHDSCLGTSNNCPYSVSYISSETSTSGILVEDVLHLRSLDNDMEFIKAYVTFGCGQVQTGSFLDIAAPNGLFGLGFEKISVPSVLSKDGLIANSFSMCFGHDGIGRISFGDKGSLDQEETPFKTNSVHPTYSVTVTEVRAGTTVLNLEFTALFDSGTSFTYLVDPPYTMISSSFNAHVKDRRRPPDSRIPFEYCYIMSPGMNTSLVPGMTLTMDGGGLLVVYDPIIVISTLHELVYCLAIVKSQELNIIGQNFMTGYRIVFDR